ncbi:hypothetical protein PR001_g20383 [Phytophthora rubi]|uniref:Uncharacterized protein n=1 Tax=Phytophthora rubi TaxID=129364 RepID=A0A6A3JK56_9STRA|nr:hypothetical protein PR001_g20383 [Phytophthora rubi]
MASIASVIVSTVAGAPSCSASNRCCCLIKRASFCFVELRMVRLRSRTQALVRRTISAFNRSHFCAASVAVTCGPICSENSLRICFVAAATASVANDGTGYMRAGRCTRIGSSGDLTCSLVP